MKDVIIAAGWCVLVMVLMYAGACAASLRIWPHERRKKSGFPKSRNAHKNG